ARARPRVGGSRSPLAQRADRERTLGSHDRIREVTSTSHSQDSTTNQGGAPMGSDNKAGGPIRVAIVGVGNCAASLVQGVHFYRDADPSQKVPGLMHVNFGPYHVSDIEFVAAFDVDAKKVGLDLSQAILASENNTIKICDVPQLD